MGMDINKINRFDWEYIDPVAITFAGKCCDVFKKYTNGSNGGEIILFRNLKDTLTSVKYGHRFHVEEYHGGSHQVKFMGDGGFARKNARCELSDLMVIVFSNKCKEARLTFLQAKYEKSKSIFKHKGFLANSEQWLLLSSRPKITGVKKFNPPQDLLSSAILHSVGSFIFFYKRPNGAFDICYSSADSLGFSYINKNSRSGRLLHINKVVRTSRLWGECVYAPTAFYFFNNLYMMRIGTPINNGPVETKKWLAGILNYHIENNNDSQKRKLASELLTALDIEGDAPKKQYFSSGNMIIIKLS